MNEDVLGNLIEKYSDRLIKYCYTILGNYQDAEDAVQDTFIRIYYKINSISNEEAIVTYMYRIAYSIGIDMLRKRKRQNNLTEKYGKQLHEKEVVYDMSQKDGLISEELHKALMMLKPLDRALLHGIAVEEMAYKELSVVFGKSETVLRKRYERARKKLQSILNESENDI